MKNGLTLSMIFEAQSANYGESYGNIGTLKKLSRGDGNSYTYISRQALRYNIINQLGWDDASSICRDEKDSKSTLQFRLDATIDKYKEIDFFGYMKTISDVRSVNRSAVARLSNAVALESFKSDTDFLTNMGLAARINAGNNIAQSEIHKSYYAYTVTIDLDRVGIDRDIVLEKAERASRVKEFLSVLATLYRDIKGRRENLSPVFIAGGVYEHKNPYFENRFKVQGNKLNLDILDAVLSLNEDVKNNTGFGYLGNVFANDADINNKLKPKTIGKFFEDLNKEVDKYYE